MRAIEHQTQLDGKSCVYACMAMVSFGEWDQARVREAMKDDTSIRAELFQLVRMGLFGDFHYDTYLKVGALHLLTVPSLNIVGGNHRIILDTRFDDHRVYDPNEGRDGCKFYRYDDLRGWSEMVTVHDVFDRGNI